MARSIEDVIKEMLGSQALQIAQLVAQLDAARDRIAELEKKDV